MPRSPRLVEPGGIYHLTPRGNDGRPIFLDDRDRVWFLLLLLRVAHKHGWIVLGYCLMTNHVHLLIQVPDGQLSAGMQELLGGYANRWNRRHGHYGHLFHNRFKSTPVLSERHLIATACYIDLNPVKAGICPDPEQWPWSSYRAHVGLEHPPAFLAQSVFLELLGATPDKARRAYRRLVHDGHVPVSDTGFKRDEASCGSGPEPRLA